MFAFSPTFQCFVLNWFHKLTYINNHQHSLLPLQQHCAFATQSYFLFLCCSYKFTSYLVLQFIHYLFHCFQKFSFPYQLLLLPYFFFSHFITRLVGFWFYLWVFFFKFSNYLLGILVHVLWLSAHLCTKALLSAALIWLNFTSPVYPLHLPFTEPSPLTFF